MKKRAKRCISLGHALAVKGVITAGKGATRAGRNF